MLGKRIAALLMALCTTVAASGCWDAMDINDKALITLVVTDRQDGDFVFYMEVPNLSARSQQESGGGEHYSIMKGAGRTYAIARGRLDTQMDKPIFLGTVRALILTENLARYDVKEYFYRMQTMVDYRRTLEVVTTRTSAEDLVSVVPENNVSIGYSIDDTVSSLQEAGKVVVYTVSDVLEFIYSDQCFVLINMDAVDGNLAYTGYTVIQDGKMRGFIPLEEAWGLLWLLGDNISRMYTVDTGEYMSTLKVDGTGRKITPHFRNGQVSFDISMSFHATMMYTSKNINFDEKQQAIVKGMLQQQLLDNLSSNISHSQEIGCDYLGFNKAFCITYPNAAKQLNWTSAYQNAAFNISVSTDLDPGGLLDTEAQGTHQ